MRLALTRSGFVAGERSAAGRSSVRAAGGRQWAGAGTTGRSGRLPERLQRVQRETHAWCGSTKIRRGLSMLARRRQSNYCRKVDYIYIRKSSVTYFCKYAF
jgi:hypothetical protein